MEPVRKPVPDHVGPRLRVFLAPVSGPVAMSAFGKGRLCVDRMPLPILVEAMGLSGLPGGRILPCSSPARVPARRIAVRRNHAGHSVFKLVSLQGPGTLPMSQEKFVITLSCPNQPGIVARVCTLLYAHRGNILEAHQYDDLATGKFFMRMVFNLGEGGDARELTRDFALVGQEYAMQWQIRSLSERQKVLLMVSKFHHCLADLLYRWRIGELPMDIVGIVANHPLESFAGLDFGDIPFHYLPITKDTKPQQEAQIKAVVEETGAELVVLARYMQILSDDMAAYLSGRCINIHHSFLPGFKGAKPYHQAHARGVKLIGATAHYVTSDLDEGPIIEQDVERITHAETPEDLVCKGRDIERRVLARAISMHLSGRALVNGSTTVVFRD